MGDVGDGSDVGNIDGVADTYIDTDDEDEDDDCVLVMVYKTPKPTDFGYFPDARYEEPCVADVMPDKVAERAAQTERRRNKWAPYRKAF